MRNVIAAITFGSVLGLSAFSPALAQMNNQTGPGMGMMGGECPTMGMMRRGSMGGGMMMGNHSRMGAMVAGRLAYLKSELKITDTQTDAWKGYADAANSRVEMMKGMRQTMMSAMQNGNAVDRMEARIAGMQAMLEAMKAIAPATEALYAVLTDDQKKTADQLIGADCGAM